MQSAFALPRESCLRQWQLRRASIHTLKRITRFLQKSLKRTAMRRAHHVSVTSDTARPIRTQGIFRTSILLAALCFAVSATAQTAHTANTKILSPQSGRASLSDYTNSSTSTADLYSNDSWSSDTDYVGSLTDQSDRSSLPSSGSTVTHRGDTSGSSTSSSARNPLQASSRGGSGEFASHAAGGTNDTTTSFESADYMGQSDAATNAELVATSSPAKALRANHMKKAAHAISALGATNIYPDGMDDAAAVYPPAWKSDPYAAAGEVPPSE